MLFAPSTPQSNISKKVLKQKMVVVSVVVVVAVVMVVILVVVVAVILICAHGNPTSTILKPGPIAKCVQHTAATHAKTINLPWPRMSLSPTRIQQLLDLIRKP